MHVTPHGKDVLDDVSRVHRILDDAGALLIRDGSIGLEDFLGISDAIGADFSDALGGANSGRVPQSGHATVFPATGQEHGYAIPMHTERYYLAKRPELLFFHCQQPPLSGGETLLCDGVALWAAFPEAVRRRFEASDIVYVRQLSGPVWRDLFRTDSPAEVQAICHGLGVAQCGHDPVTDVVTTRFACPAYVETPRGVSFSNNFLPFAMRELGAIQPLTSYVRFADREDVPIDHDFIRAVQASAEALSLGHAWQAGDIVVLDNRSVLHGRPQLTDTRRRILLRMAGGRRASVAG